MRIIYIYIYIYICLYIHQHKAPGSTDLLHANVLLSVRRDGFDQAVMLPFHFLRITCARQEFCVTL